MKDTALARAGFLYTGEGEKVMCPWCGVVLTEWEVFDDPHIEHRKWSPQCKFIDMVYPSTDNGIFN